MRREAEATTAIFPFVRTEPQMAALQECVALWRAGPEKFWAYGDILEALARPRSLGFFAAEAAASRSWQGVILADVGPYTADLLYVYIRPEARRRGLAQGLVERLLEELKKAQQIEALFLEVRASNKAAQALYLGLGMELVGQRRAYYADGEDAQIYRMPLRTGDARG